MSVVNALSETLHTRSVVTAILQPGLLAWRAAGPARAGPELAKGEGTGTTITYLADADIFESLDYDFQTLEERLRETAFLTRG